MNSAVHVDGTNALHRLGAGASADLPADQGRLVDAVRALVRARPRGPRLAQPASATVHFDGFPRGGGYAGTESDGVHVRWSQDREADEDIVDAVRAAGSPARVLVVTDDATLAARVRSLGAGTRGVAAYFRTTDRPADDKPTPGGFTAADFGLPESIDLDDPPWA